MDKTTATIETYDLCAETFEEKFMGLELYASSLTLFAGLLKKGTRLLDLGCGPGNVSRFLGERVSEIETTGIDLSKEMVKLARKNVPQAEFLVGDIRDLHLPEASRDAVTAAFCLPFLHDHEALDLIREIEKVLKPGGYLYMSCMEGTGEGFETTSFSGGNSVFMNYFSESFMREAFAKNGLGVLDYLPQGYPEEDGTVTTDMIFIVEKPL